MNRKGSFDEIIMGQLVFVLIGLMFLSVMLVFLWQFKGGAITSEDYYVKEIVRIVNLAKPGDNITLDMQKASELAYSNGLRENELLKIVQVDNTKNEISVKLSKGKEMKYSYFNNVDLVDLRIELGSPGTLLKFSVAEKRSAA